MSEAGASRSTLPRVGEQRFERDDEVGQTGVRPPPPPFASILDAPAPCDVARVAAPPHSDFLDTSEDVFRDHRLMLLFCSELLERDQAVHEAKIDPNRTGEGKRG